MSLVYVNGKISSPEDAVISVYDRGFLFGDAIYEVVRSYGKVLFTAEEHIARLYKSAKALQIDIGMSQEEFLKELYAFYKQEQKENVYIRIQISRGNVKKEQISLMPSNFDQANIVMYMHDLKPPNQEDYSKGTALFCSPIIRNTKSALDPNIKSGNYLNNIISLLGMDASNYQDSILLNQDGMVTEGTTFNIFMVKKGQILTSPDDADILHGITRQVVFEIAKEQQIPIKTELFSIEELYQADEVFKTSSTKEIVPVSSIDGKSIGDGLPGKTTLRLMDLYRAYVESHIEMAKSKHPWN